MKKIFFLSIFLTALSLKAQDERLLALYSQDQLTEISQTNPEIISYWETFLTKGWIIAEVKENTLFEGTLEIDGIENFNPLAHQIYPKQGTRYYAINGSQKVLIVYPKSHIIYLYNQK